MKLYKIWNNQLEMKKCIMAETLTDVITKGSAKFGIKVRYVYLNDGTEVEDDEVLRSLEAGTILHLETSPSTTSAPFPSKSESKECGLQSIHTLVDGDSTDGDIALLDSNNSKEAIFLDSEESGGELDKKRKPAIDHNGPSFSAKKMKLPYPLQLPDTIPEVITDILKNKPCHPRFYQARVTMVKKAREFFAGCCPYPSTQEYEAMVSCMGRAFPHLKDPGVKESDPPRVKYCSLLAQLQQGFRNSRRRSSFPTSTNNKPRHLAKIDEKDDDKDDSQNTVDNTAYQRMLDELKRQLQTTIVNDNVVKKLMKETFSLRRKWISEEEFMSISKICDEFPFLEDPKWILQECSIITFLKDVLKETTANLNLYLQAVTVAVGLETDDEFEDAAELDISRLWKIFQMMQVKLCKQSDCILFECEVGCNLKDLFKRKGNEPFLVAIVSEKKEVQQIFIGAEKRELLEVEDANVITALTLLVSCYYVFNIAYKKGKNVLIFLQELMLGIPDKSKKSSKYATFYKQIVKGTSTSDSSDN